jgi:hypothetical protein
MLWRSLILVLALALAFGAAPMAAKADDGGTISIMKPEPGTPAAKKTPRKARGSSNPVYPTPLPGPQKPAPIPHLNTARPRTKTPPDLYVPQTGRVVPNQPAQGSGLGGVETFQDRSSRCVNQAGVNAGTAGDRGTYIRSCINQ